LGKDESHLVEVRKTSLEEILPLRQLFLQENNFQIRYNACHERGWTDSYVLTLQDIRIGYGSIKGKENLRDRNALFEFYLLPTFRNRSSQIFSTLLHASRASFIESQTNDVLLSSMLYEFADQFESKVILFEDHSTTCQVMEAVVFRPRQENESVYEHQSEPEGDWVLEYRKEIVATGGFLLHYNIPFADLYMEVKPDHRGKGLGTFLLQELKRQCYLSGRVPAARCNIENLASKAALLKAGFRIAGYMLCAKVK
jgi:RimJ/RimL family protein N-acetyltransferase